MRDRLLFFNFILIISLILLTIIFISVSSISLSDTYVSDQPLTSNNETVVFISSENANFTIKFETFNPKFHVALCV